MKRIIALFLMLVMAFSLTSCGGDVSDVKIDYGKSEIYTKEDMDAAIKVIKKEFKTWTGCVLDTLSYTSDEQCNEENIEWMNDLAKGQNLEPNFDQYIEFVSDFHVLNIPGVEGFDAPNDYTGWSWSLARSNGGKWHLLTWGYA